MVTLQQRFSSMEETVRNILQNQDSMEGPKVDPLDLMKAYKDKLLEEMWKQQDSLELAPVAAVTSVPIATETAASVESRGGSEDDPLLERLRALEAENTALSVENDNQRKQYERCLDEVANQVVQALLTQKDLKEECVKLRTRVFDLEQQNSILSVLFQQRVKMAAAPHSQDLQRNGKAVAVGRWPSLLSLTCPRTSGSDLSLSSGCSEYSSGSHTWAEGRGLSKQCGGGRDKRLSSGSFSSNKSAPIEPTELGWKEGHILKGLKRLQMCPKEASLLPTAPHCKDCMTSNEGIYSFGIKCGQKVSATKQATPASKANKDVIVEVAANVAYSEAGEQPTKELLSLEKLGDSKAAGNTGLLLSPVTDNFSFLPTVKPGVSPTDGLLQTGDDNSLERQKSLKLSDKNNNQEKTTDRKSRLDQVKKQQGGLKQVEKGSIQSAATRALSNEARQRSSSMEVPQRRDQAIQVETQENGTTESSQPGQRLDISDSARRAFILRSKSADGGQDQAKHTHSPLHQKLIKDHKQKGQASPSGQSGASKRTSYSKTHSAGKNSVGKIEREEHEVVTTSKSLDSVQNRSPLASPVKNSKPFKPQEGLKSPTKIPMQITRCQSNNEANEDGVYDNLLCSPRKQRRQDYDVPNSDRRSPSPPPLPPGRSTSLLLRSSSDSKTQMPLGVKMSNSAKSNQLLCGQDNLYAKVDTHIGSARIFQVHESQAVPPAVTCHNENGPHFILASQNILQRSQQSISEPKLSEALPHTYSNVFYHGIVHNPQGSRSRGVKMAVPVNAKSHEAIAGQDSNTFLVFERAGKDDIKCLKTFQTFSCDPQKMQDEKARRRVDMRCNSLDSEPCGQPLAPEHGVMLDWGFDEEGWLFKRSVSVSTRPPFKPVLGMNGAKARSQSFGARYMDRPSFNRSGKVRTQIKTHSGCSLNSLGDVLPGSMSCSSSYHCPMNRSLLNNFLIEEGLAAPSHLGSSSERLQSLKLQREQARRLQIEQQFSSAFGEPVSEEPVSEEPERQSTITTIEEKVMIGIEENLHKSQEQERTTDQVKPKSGSSLANWFGFRKSKLPAPSKKTEAPKVKEEKREQKITSLLGGKQTKADKKRERRKSEGKEIAVTRREPHDAVRSCISMPCPGMSLSDLQGHTDITGDPKIPVLNRRSDSENGSAVTSPSQDAIMGSGCTMRTLDSGIGTIPLPESCSFFSSILHLLPKSSSTPEQALGPCVPGCSSPLPRWRVPSGFKDHAGVPSSLSDSSVPLLQSVPFPSVAFLQPAAPPSEPQVTAVCEPHSRLPRPQPGDMEPKKMNCVKSKPRPTPSQQKEQSRLQLANCEPPSSEYLYYSATVCPEADRTIEVRFTWRTSASHVYDPGLKQERAGPKVDQERTKSGPKVDQKWTKSGPKVDRTDPSGLTHELTVARICTSCFL
ncbi:uncharacterized protein [Eucyclogobius newberryi]|uniref:uncharacterized protein n=1 Tax=Eucyclogobius newberryi TaxID=166745 RepID=UPI003B5CFA65